VVEGSSLKVKFAKITIFRALEKELGARINKGLAVRATLKKHMSQEPRAKSRDREIVRTQNKWVQRPSQDTSKIIYYVWSLSLKVRALKPHNRRCSWTFNNP
jgi:hypothetical protein